MKSRAEGGLIQGLGSVATTSLVTGNIIGSGIYVMPASLADVAGPLSLLAWLLVAAGYLCLTFVYADLAGAYPISGGLQIYTQKALGDFAGLETAFLYWVSCVIGNAAFLTAFVGYFRVFAPRFSSPVSSFLIAQVLLWALTLANVLGVRVGGVVQVVTTILKILPLLILSVALFSVGSPSNLVPFAPKGYGAIFPAISLVAWLLLGAETVTVPAEEVRGAGRTIRRSAYLGYFAAVVVYFLVASSVCLGLPSSEIVGSASPLAKAAQKVLGPWGEAFVTAGALVSIAGILNGWLLVVGRLPFAAARHGIGPAPFARLHPRFGTPVLSLVVSSSCSGLLVLLYFSRTLLEAYNFIALASTATALVAIGLVCMAHFSLLRRDSTLFTPVQRRRGPFLAFAGFLIVLVMISGSGWWVGFTTLLAMALPVPYYLWLRRRRT